MGIIDQWHSLRRGHVQPIPRRCMAVRSAKRRRHAVRFEALEPRVLLAVVDDLRISEIMYHPADPTPGGAWEGKDFEYLELINTGVSAIDLSGVTISEGIDFAFDGSAVTALAPGERVLVVSDQAAFTSRYSAGLNIAGQFARSLSNSTETIVVAHETAGMIQSVTYQDSWHPNSDGNGFSLVMLDPAVNASLWNEPTSWRASLLGGGSPGAAEPTPLTGDIVISELLSHTDQDGGDWIELHNTTDQDINVAGWYLSDNDNELTRFQIDGDRFIPASGHLVFTQDADFGNPRNPLAARPFGFSELGESAHLTSWDFNGATAAYQEAVFFGASDREVTFGRYARGDQSVVFVSMRFATPGRTNSPPLVGPLVISEIMYNPPGANEDGEFIELHNPTARPVPLFDPLHPENTWLLRDEGGNELSFPAGITIAPGGFALIVGIAPAVFRAGRDVPDDVPVIGPFSGSLSNAGEFVEVYRPGDPELDLTVPMYLVDRVRYDDRAPWPVPPDGGGFTLVRRSAGEFGDDVVNWGASRQVGGTPGTTDRSLPGDTNGDGQVDIDDLNNVRNHFGESGPGVVGDATGDGRVNLDDLNAVRNNFGAALPLEAAAPDVALRAAAVDLAIDDTAVVPKQRRAHRFSARLPRRFAAAGPRMAVVWDQALIGIVAPRSR